MKEIKKKIKKGGILETEQMIKYNLKDCMEGSQ
jgi:hypothetical protein